MKLSLHLLWYFSTRFGCWGVIFRCIYKGTFSGSEQWQMHTLEFSKIFIQAKLAWNIHITFSSILLGFFSCPQFEVQTLKTPYVISCFFCQICGWRDSCLFICWGFFCLRSLEVQWHLKLQHGGYICIGHCVHCNVGITCSTKALGLHIRECKDVAVCYTY